MTLSSGTRLGPYEILAPIGAGGMGEVYEARDTRLDRAVAVKILPAEFAGNAQLKTRFEREARTISRLSHPNICTLFDVGENYIVMELLEGESLADRVLRGPLPIGDVLKYGVQIAEALDKAHREGVIHRDLKPGNVMITKGGAKLLDFGLAKSVVSASSPEGATAQKPLTQEGMVLGTFQYMAPEQLAGEEPDARTDIFALGALLYEMATGRRAFEGKTKTSLIGAIVSGEPKPMQELQPLTPPAFERVVRVCLAKDPDDRWQSAHDVAAELRWIGEQSSSAATARVAVGVPRRMVWGIAGAIAGLAIGAAGIWLTYRDRAAVAPVARFTVPLPASAPVFFSEHVVIAISPDGTKFLYAGGNGNKVQLYVRALDQLVPVPIPGTDGALIATFSPDGHWIAFGAQDGLKKVSLDGGIPVMLAKTAEQPAVGIRWIGRNLYFARGFTDGIWTVPDSGGAPRQIIKVNPEKGVRAVVWPDVLPDGKTILATVWNNGSWDDARIVAYPIGGGEPKVLIDGGTCATYVPTGHLLYGRGGALLAVPFDAAALKVIGSAVPVVNGVASGVINGDVQYAVSSTGILLYAGGGVLENKRSLVWIDRHGKEQPAIPTQRPYSLPAVSPDGQTFAVTLETATFDVWQLDVDRDTVTRVSYGGDDSAPVWTPDGRRIIWASSRPGHNNLFWAAADNSAGEERLTNSPHSQVPTSVSPDGRFVAVTEYNGHDSDLMLLSLEGDHKEQPFLATRFNERFMTFSPDGKWVTYISDESGRSEAYIRRFSTPGGTWKVSVDGATTCRWAHNGKEIVYTNGDKFYLVSVATEPQVRIGKPQFLFERPFPPGPLARWDFSLDDQRILWMKADAPHTASELQIVMNWFPELKRRVPAR